MSFSSMRYMYEYILIFATHMRWVRFIPVKPFPTMFYAVSAPVPPLLVRYAVLQFQEMRFP